VADQVTDIMKKEGGFWIERHRRLDSENSNIDDLGRIQTLLMEVLWASCIPQMESELLQYARCNEQERISDMELKDLSFGLKSAISRAQTQQFSIAFCGMVKAGCVAYTSYA
jgi:hypothetical protein